MIGAKKDYNYHILAEICAYMSVFLLYMYMEEMTGSPCWTLIYKFYNSTRYLLYPVHISSEIIQTITATKFITMFFANR